jgi:hypothetical protein
MPADTCVHHQAYHTGRGSAIFQRSDSFEYVYRETHRIGGTVWRAVAALRPNKRSESYVLVEYHDPTTGTWTTFDRLGPEFVNDRCELQGGAAFDEAEALGQAADLAGEMVQIAAAAYPHGVPHAARGEYQRATDLLLGPGSITERSQLMPTAIAGLGNFEG